LGSWAWSKIDWNVGFLPEVPLILEGGALVRRFFYEPWCHPYRPHNQILHNLLKNNSKSVFFDLILEDQFLRYARQISSESHFRCPLPYAKVSPLMKIEKTRKICIKKQISPCSLNNCITGSHLFSFCFSLNGPNDPAQSEKLGISSAFAVSSIKSIRMGLPNPLAPVVIENQVYFLR
jgi:hypothetical protein